MSEDLLRKWIRGILSEDLTGYQASNYPYRYGKAPGFGYGTGMGGFSHTRPHRGSLGGNQMGYYPRGKPYADEFTGALQDVRQTEWQAAITRFGDAIRSLKRDLQTASSKHDIDKCLDRIALGDRDLVDEIVPDAGAYRVALKRGDITKARSMLLQGLDGWADRIRSKHERMDLDSAGLDRWSYDNTSAEKLGAGSGRWS